MYKSVERGGILTGEDELTQGDIVKLCSIQRFAHLGSEFAENDAKYHGA